MVKRNANKFLVAAITSLAVISLVLAGCSSQKPATQGKVDYPTKPFEFIAPAGPGGGWDTTIRMVAKVLGDQKIVTQSMPVINKPGGGGGVALSYLNEKKGNPYEVAVYSPPLLLINLTGQTKLSYQNTTPIAMLINDFGAFAVPKNSKFNSINEVMDALKKDPKSVKVGGTSSPGSMDHIQFLIAAKAAGVTNLKDIPYVAFQGGEGTAALMGGHIDILTTGMAETVGGLQSGDIKVLALTSPEHIKDGPLAQVPTLKEKGINTVFINWRGLFGPPEMPDYAVKYLGDSLKKMSETGDWDAICKKNGWIKSYMPADEFKNFLAKTNDEYKAVLQELGLLKN
jgi:putative tricarboxylic transport membrane protein